MASQHTIQPGESLLSIAHHYGFGSTEPVATHPDNKALIDERGDAGIETGDVLTIPDGAQGEHRAGTGRVHEVAVRRSRVFEVRLLTAFHKENPDAIGDWSARNTAGTWRPVFFKKKGHPIRQIKAAVEVALVHGITADAVPRKGLSNSKTGIFHTLGLSNGSWKVTITPIPDELSSGPAAADPQADHGRGFYNTKRKPATTSEGKAVSPLAKAFPNNRNYELEYRPLVIDVDVAEGEVTQAKFHDPPAPERPHHAVLFWRNVENKGDRQVLEIDWKPDFVRRVVGSSRPRILTRGGAGSLRSKIDVIMFHHTAGFSIGSVLFTFTNKRVKSGAHFVIDLDGHVVRMADDLYQTRHGGGGSKTRPPSWRNDRERSMNERSIGIEHVHKDQQLSGDSIADPQPYTEAQYRASIDLIRGLRAAYDVKLPDLIGHQDAVAKAACPGWHVDWPRLEAAGVALTPATLSLAEQEAMLGGFFAGAEGRERRLAFGSEEAIVKTTDETTTTSVENKKGVVVATNLNGPPIQQLRQALANIGYSTETPIVVSGTKHTYQQRRDAPVFETTLGYALSQFIRHYCTESRLRADLHRAYRDSPRVWTGLFVDRDLAMLIIGASKAATEAR